MGQNKKIETAEITYGYNKNERLFSLKYINDKVNNLDLFFGFFFQC